MALIRAAYFVQCSLCLRHGSVICVDGQQALCFTQTSARQSAVYMHSRGWISDHEMPVLQNSITRSTLPLKQYKSGPIALECFALLGELLAREKSKSANKPPRTARRYGQDVTLN